MQFTVLSPPSSLPRQVRLRPLPQEAARRWFGLHQPLQNDNHAGLQLQHEGKHGERFVFVLDEEKGLWAAFGG